MTDALTPYPAYQDSGLPWLGRVPAHWENKRGKVLFNKVTRPVRTEDEVIICFRDGVVTLRKNRRLRGFTEAIFELGYQETFGRQELPVPQSEEQAAIVRYMVHFAVDDAEVRMRTELAGMEHDKALARVMLDLLQDDTAVYRQFVQNESFKRFVSDMVFQLAA